MREPAISFNQAALKIKWSQQLISDLNRYCTAFINSKPYHVSFEPNSDGTYYRFGVGLAKDIPSVIQLLAGDICGNLRASLDYAWTGIIRKENPAQADKRTLPFADNRKGLISAIPKTSVKIAVK